MALGVGTGLERVWHWESRDKARWHWESRDKDKAREGVALGKGAAHGE